MIDLLTSDTVFFLLAVIGGIYAILHFVKLDLEADYEDRQVGRSAKYGNRRPDKSRR